MTSPFMSSVSIPNKFTHPEDVMLMIEPTKKQVSELDPTQYRACVLINGTEPPNVTPHRVDEQNIREHADKFDLIMTYNDTLVEELSHAESFQFGSCWVSASDRESIKIEHKKSKVSFIRSRLKRLPGHMLRHKIDFTDLNKSVELFHPPSGSIKNKATLFTDSMFHVCVENSQVRNYFTEKIVDCFATYTVPIYWGCPNIADFWDEDGIILFEDIKHLNSILSGLNIDMYQEKQLSIKRNKQIAEEKYVDFHSNVSSRIKKFLSH